MRVLFWNARGIDNQDTRLVLKNMTLGNKPDLVLIAEPRIDLCNFPESFWSKLKLKVFAVNNRNSFAPNLWCICASSISPGVIVSSSLHVTFSVVWESQLIYLTSVYAATTYTVRSLWHELAQLSQSFDGPWCYMGDFNDVVGAHEHRGCRVPARASCEEFQTWTDANNLIHSPPIGAEFIWSNRIGGSALTERRLDRVICNDP